MNWIRLFDITASVLTVVSLWNVSKSHKWWILYFPGTVCFIIVAVSKGLWGLTVMGLILLVTAVRNYKKGVNDHHA